MAETLFEIAFAIALFLFVAVFLSLASHFIAWLMHGICQRLLR